MTTEDRGTSAMSDQLGRFWRTEVDCWYIEKPRSKAYKLVRRTILVQAQDDTAAFDAAERHARQTAPFGPKWTHFQARSATTVNLPLTIGARHS